MTRSPYTLWLWPIISVLLALTAAAAVIRLERPVDEPPAIAQVTPPEPAPTPTAAEPSEAESLLDTIGRNDTIYLSLKRHGVSGLELMQLNEAMRDLFDPSSLKPGDSYRLVLGREGEVTRFSYVQRNQPEQVLHVERTAEGDFSAQRIVEPLDSSIVVLQVTIEDNLSNAIADAGESVLLTDLLADRIFGSVIDFNKDPRKGDRIALVLRKLFKDGDFVRYDRVLLARYHGEIVSQLAVFYETEEGGEYYDENGKSVERMFLLSPLSYRRISSGFSHKRFHPVLKRNMPHLGMDFAADKGTKVWATARGTVSYAGGKGGYGKLVRSRIPTATRPATPTSAASPYARARGSTSSGSSAASGPPGARPALTCTTSCCATGATATRRASTGRPRVAPLPEDQKILFFAHRDRLLARTSGVRPAVALQNPGR